MRREAARAARRIERSENIGGLENVYEYNKLFRCGKDCCKNVRWKQSTQRFETHLFSRTAVSRRLLLDGEYKFSPYVHFILNERGKSRPIDAPRIEDRQVEKAFTRNVLLPLYMPSMIHNNGASLPGKGFAFSREKLKEDLRQHYRKYGREGYIILTDGKKFFPNADHSKIYERHRNHILDDGLRALADQIVGTVSTGVGMPLGVEPSQAEMIAYPSALDNYMTCQMGLRGYGHYMDDFYALVPPHRDPKEIVAVMREKGKQCGIMLNVGKTLIIPLTKPFRYCKAKYIMTVTGKIVVRASKTAMPRYRKKLDSLYKKISAGNISMMDIWASINGMTAYLAQYDEHNHMLELRRRFYRLFGFSCECCDEFQRRNGMNEIYSD